MRRDWQTVGLGAMSSSTFPEACPDPCERRRERHRRRASIHSGLRLLLLGLAGFGWLAGVEHGANLLGVGWLWTWIHALRTRPAHVPSRGALAAAD